MFPSSRVFKAVMGFAAFASLIASSMAGPLEKERADRILGKIDHIIVIYQENWSFDSLYGKFPGANGFANAFPPLVQWNKTTGYKDDLDQTPQPLNGGPDPRFPPANGSSPLPLLPYDLTTFIGTTQKTGDLVHRFYTEQLQIDNGILEPSKGSMDKFVTWSDNPGLVLSYFDATNLPEGRLAKRYILCDRFFHSAYGGSFLNHFFLVAAAAPRWRQPIPEGFKSTWDPSTRTLKDGNLTIDGKYVVNTAQPAQGPHPASIPPNKQLNAINNENPALPDYMPTIGNRLDEKGITWKWYSGGWDEAIKGHPSQDFQFHHQPFAYFTKYAPFHASGSLNADTTGPNAHLQDEKNFLRDLSREDLPAVSFIKPLGPDNEHPGYASLLKGQEHVAKLVNAVQKSKGWKSSLIIITYDENGGRWDHVPPPKMEDGWGLGTRVPAIVISASLQKGLIDDTSYETVSILKLIEHRFGLRPVSGRDANPAVNDLAKVFEMGDETGD